MIQKIVKETYTSRHKGGVGMKLLLDDGQELDFILSRDTAIGFIEQIYVALDTLDANKPKNIQ